MAVTDEFHSALASENRLDGLRRATERELQTGTTREQVIAQLEELRADLRELGRGDDEDLVLEAMDFVTGWCSPHVRL
jgi:hypothetical protein